MKNSWAISNRVWRSSAACYGLNASLAAMIAELNAPVKYMDFNEVLSPFVYR
jgi:hypothetical protein